MQRILVVLGLLLTLTLTSDRKQDDIPSYLAPTITFNRKSTSKGGARRTLQTSAPQLRCPAPAKPEPAELKQITTNIIVSKTNQYMLHEVPTALLGDSRIHIQRQLAMFNKIAAEPHLPFSLTPAICAELPPREVPCFSSLLMQASALLTGRKDIASEKGQAYFVFLEPLKLPFPCDYDCPLICVQLSMAGNQHLSVFYYYSNSKLTLHLTDGYLHVSMRRVSSRMANRSPSSPFANCYVHRIWTYRDAILSFPAFKWAAAYVELCLGLRVPELQDLKEVGRVKIFDDRGAKHFGALLIGPDWRASLTLHFSELMVHITCPSGRTFSKTFN